MSTIDPESVRLAQMVEAARGHLDNVPLALQKAGFTMEEILEEHLDVARILRQQEASADYWARQYANDNEECQRDYDEERESGWAV